MGRISQVLVLALNGLLLTAAIPQYGQPSGGGGAAYSQGAPAQGAPPPPPPPPQHQQQAYASAGGAGAGSSAGGSAGGSGGAGGQLSIQCKATPDGSGHIKYDCSGVDKNAITLKTEHFLWLESQGGSSQALDIEIPNYSIDEFIKAAYKGLGPQEGAKINILLKKPDLTYNAEKDQPPQQQQGSPSVSVNYQPVDKVSVHYPTQKQYGSGGPAPPPPSAAPPPAPAPGPGPAPGGPAPGGPAQAAPAYSRPQRESGYRYYFIRQ